MAHSYAIYAIIGQMLTVLFNLIDKIKIKIFFEN